MPRRLASAALFALVLLLERFAYYGTRALLFQHLRDAFPGAIDSAHVMTGFTWAIALTPLLGAAACALAPARFVAVLGLLGAIAGYGLLGLAHGPLLLAPLGLIALALGLFRPAILVAAGDLFPKRENARVAVFCLLYLSINLGALGSLPLFAAIRTHASAAPAFFLAAAIALVATILAAVAAALPLLLRDDEPPPAPEPFRPAPLLASLGLAIAAAPSFLVTELVSRWQFSGPEVPEWLDYLNPAVILPLCVVFGALFAALAFTPRRIPIAFPIAAGLVITAVASVPALVLPPDTALIAATIAAAALGEALIAPLVLARLAAGVHPRAQGAVMAFWLGASFIPALVFRLLPEGLPSKIALAALLVLCLVFAIALAASFRLLQNAFEPAEA